MNKLNIDNDIKSDVYYFLNLYRDILMRKTVVSNIVDVHDINDKLFRINRIFDYFEKRYVGVYMSEEEIINRLTEPKKYSLIEILRKFKRDGIENYIITKPELIQGLLDLYYKEKEKNKELYDKGYKEGYIKGVQPQIFENWERSNAKTIKIKSNYISKDKIRRKIEEYNKQRQETGNSIIYTRMIDYIDCLNELLGE